MSKGELTPMGALTKGISNLLPSSRPNAEQSASNTEKAGINVLDAFPTSMKTLFTKTTSSSTLMSVLFIGFAIAFGFIFFYANINANGNTKPTFFVGYCVWAWIIMLCAILALRMLGKFSALFWKIGQHK
jgi:hypothetical protein